MADKDFRIDLILGAKFAEAFRALDQAKRKVGDVEQAAGKFNRTAGTAVGTAIRGTAIAATAAATAAAAVMSLYIAKTIEAEKVQAQLQARIKDTGGVAGRTLQQLNQQAGQLQSITVFDDEAIGNAQAMLLTFNQIRGENFDRTIASALDLATVMGTDASDAAKVLGKALSDPEKGLAALSKAGVVFTDGERERIKAMVEAGQVAEAQAAILDKLQGTMGSAAEAARDTLGGALQALKNSFDNLLEGDSGDAGVQGTRDAIESLITTLNDPSTKQAFDNIIGSMVSLTAQTIDGVAAIQRLLSNVKTIQDLAAKDAKGAKPSDYTDREAEVKLQLLSRQKSAANKRGDKEEVARLQAQITSLIRDGTRRIKDEMVAQGVDAAFDFLKSPVPKADPKPDGQGVASQGKSKSAGGSKSDPDADIKRRIESLREEASLLGAVKEGEDKASEAAKVRYAITEGEFKNKSPQLKAELLAAAEALDAKNADIEKEKERKEAIKDSADAYAALRAELRTPAEVAVDDAIAKLKALADAARLNDAAPGDVAQAQDRVITGAFDKAPDVSGGYNPFDQFTQDRERIEAWHQEQLDKLAEFRQQRADLSAEWDRQEEAIEAQHQAAMQSLQYQQSQMMLGAASSLFGSLAEIARQGGGEQSKAYRAMFALSQGFAVAQALIAVYQNAANAMKDTPYPYNIPIIASAIAQGLAIVAQIRAVSPSGYAEGGYTGPGGKYQPAGIVHKGEGVLSQEEIAKLGGPTGFYQLRALIHEGELLNRQRAIAGYAAGGLVGVNGPALAPPDFARYPQGADGFKANLQNDMAIHLHADSYSMFEAAASTPKGRKLILGMVSENGQAIKAAWGS